MQSPVLLTPGNPERFLQLPLGRSVGTYLSHSEDEDYASSESESTSNQNDNTPRKLSVPGSHDQRLRRSNSLPSIHCSKPLLSHEFRRKIGERYHYPLWSKRRGPNWRYFSQARYKDIIKSTTFLERCLMPGSAAYRWIVLFFTCWMSFGSYIFYYSVSALYTDLKEGMSINDTQLGLLYSVYNIPNVVMVFFAGIMVDKLGVRWSAFVFMTMTTLGPILFCFGLGSFFIPKSFWILVVARFVAGVGSESSYVVQDTIAAMWFRGKEVALAMGLVTSACGLGEIFGFAFLPEISESTDYITTFWIVALFCVGSFLSTLAYLWLDKRAEGYAQAHGTASSNGSEASGSFHLRQLLSFPLGYWLLSFVLVAFYATLHTFLAFCPNFLQQEYGFSEKESGRTTAIISIVSTVLPPFLGLALDKWGKQGTTTVFGSFLLALAFVLHLISSMSAFVPIFAIAFAASVVPTAVWPCMVTTVKRDVFGTAYGLTSALINVVSMVSFLFFGELFRKSNTSAAILSWIALSSLAFVVSVIWMGLDIKQGGYSNLPASEVDTAELEEDEEEGSDTAETRPLMLTIN